MTQSAAGVLNEFPNLIELIGRQRGLHDSETWWGPAIGIDEVADGIPARAIGSDELGTIAIGSDEQGIEAIGSHDVNVDALPAAHENFLQDEIQQRALEVIGQDEITGIPAAEWKATSLCSDEVIGQDELPDAPAVELDAMSICSDENILQDEIAPSDSRLKTGITQVGTTAHGLPLYNFSYIGKPEVYEGVMAQDVLKVMPSAVVHGADGYYRVNYKNLGVQMRRVA